MTEPAQPIPRDDSPIDRGALFALLCLLAYSFAMFTLPFAAFYGTRHYLTNHFQLEDFTVTCGSVIAAVVTVNLIIVLYALQGFREAEKEEKEHNKKDD